MNEQEKVLPPDVYDALEFSALAFGGIGAGKYETPSRIPYCVIGHQQAVAADNSWSRHYAYGEVSFALTHAGIHEGTNDPAVHAINKRLGKWKNSRVTFEQWCKELNVVRGLGGKKE